MYNEKTHGRKRPTVDRCKNADTMPCKSGKLHIHVSEGGGDCVRNGKAQISPKIIGASSSLICLRNNAHTQTETEYYPFIIQQITRVVKEKMLILSYCEPYHKAKD